MNRAHETSRDLAFLLLAAASKLERRLDRALSNIQGITFSEYLLLHALEGRYGAVATRVELAEAVDLSPSGVTRALKPLEQLGYVSTTKDARDARRSLARLTPEGRVLVSDASDVIGEVLADVVAIDSIFVGDRNRITEFLDDLIHT